MAEVNENMVKYINYIDEHIKNIFICYEKYGKLLCEKLDISKAKLRTRVSTHDKSKYSNKEFKPYMQYFYPDNEEEKNRDLFLKGWFHHLKKNDHHPEFWTYVDDENKPRIMDMSKEAIAEMLLDWAAMGLKFGDTAYSYYKKNRDIKPLSENTKKIIDEVIDIFNEGEA